MPVTPLHIGIPGLPAIFRPDRVDITAAVLGSTLVDLDFFLHVFMGYRIHGNLHTFPGATLLALVIILLVKIGDPLNVKIKKWFRWETKTNLKGISVGAFFGTFSHVFLDSVLYSDIRPIRPVSDDNPLYTNIGGEGATELVYGVAAVTTVVLLVLWVWNVGRSYKPEKRE